jgi:hypothetical protein
MGVWVCGAVIVCGASTFSFATWPAFAPYGDDTVVSGTCLAGYNATNIAAPTQAVCLSTGTYNTTADNVCVRTST